MVVENVCLNSTKLEFYSCEFDWTNQCPVDQSKCIFKVVVDVFDVERKCHGGMPQLSYITVGEGGGARGAPYVIFQQITHGNTVSES